MKPTTIEQNLKDLFHHNSEKLLKLVNNEEMDNETKLKRLRRMRERLIGAISVIEFTGEHIDELRNLVDLHTTVLEVRDEILGIKE